MILALQNTPLTLDLPNRPTYRPHRQTPAQHVKMRFTTVLVAGLAALVANVGAAVIKERDELVSAANPGALQSFKNPHSGSGKAS